MPGCVPSREAGWRGGKTRRRAAGSSSRAKSSRPCRSRPVPRRVCRIRGLPECTGTAALHGGAFCLAAGKSKKLMLSTFWAHGCSLKGPNALVCLPPPHTGSLVHPICCATSIPFCVPLCEKNKWKDLLGNRLHINLVLILHNRGECVQIQEVPISCSWLSLTSTAVTLTQFNRRSQGQTHPPLQQDPEWTRAGPSWIWSGGNDRP